MLQYSFADFHLNVWEQLNLQVLLQTGWHFFLNNVMKIFFCLIQKEHVLCESRQLSQIHWPFICLQVWLKLSCNPGIIQQWKDLCVMTAPRFGQLVSFHPVCNPLSDHPSTPLCSKPLTFSGTFGCMNQVSMIVDNQMQATLDWLCAISLQSILAGIKLDAMSFSMSCRHFSGCLHKPLMLFFSQCELEHWSFAVFMEVVEWY